MLEQNKETLLRVFDELFNQTKIEIIPDLYTDDVTGLDPANGGGLMGHDAIAGLVASHREAFPRHRYQVQSMTGEKDRVCAHWSVFDDMTFTGVEQEVTQGLSLCEFREGKICRVWQHWDNLGMLQQLQVIDPDLDIAGEIATRLTLLRG